LAYEILVKAPDAHWWYTKINAQTEQSDLMISCNFDVPVETDAMPFTQREHKNHSHSYEKTTSFNFKKDSKIVLESKSNGSNPAADGSEYNAFL
jgi:hypothetical protein